MRTSHTRTVLSSLIVTISLPCEEKATPLIELLWPRRGLPSRTFRFNSQIRTILSLDPDARYPLDDENATHRTQLVCPMKGWPIIVRLSTFQIVTCRSAPSSERCTVRGICDTPQLSIVSMNRFPDWSPPFDVPCNKSHILGC